MTITNKITTKKYMKFIKNQYKKIIKINIVGDPILTRNKDIL